MSKLLDINGKELQKDIDLANLDLDKLKDVEFDKSPCPVGTECIGQSLQAFIEKDDVVYKLHLVFGTQVFQIRMPIQEVTVETLRTEWMNLLVLAMSHFHNGYEYKDEIQALKAFRMKAQE